MSAPAASPRSYRGIALCVTVLCALAATAAVVSFVEGSWPLGVVWVLLAGLASNMAWYYGRRARRAAAPRRTAASPQPGGAPGAAPGSGPESPQSPASPASEATAAE